MPNEKKMERIAWLLLTLLGALSLYVWRGACDSIEAAAIECREATRVNAIQTQRLDDGDRWRANVDAKLDRILERLPPR